MSTNGSFNLLLHGYYKVVEIKDYFKEDDTIKFDFPGTNYMTCPLIEVPYPIPPSLSLYINKNNMLHAGTGSIFNIIMVHVCPRESSSEVYLARMF